MKTKPKKKRREKKKRTNKIVSETMRNFRILSLLHCRRSTSMMACAKESYARVIMQRNRSKWNEMKEKETGRERGAKIPSRKPFETHRLTIFNVYFFDAFHYSIFSVVGHVFILSHGCFFFGALSIFVYAQHFLLPTMNLKTKQKTNDVLSHWKYHLLKII